MSGELMPDFEDNETHLLRHLVVFDSVDNSTNDYLSTKTLVYCKLRLKMSHTADIQQQNNDFSNISTPKLNTTHEYDVRQKYLQSLHEGASKQYIEPVCCALENEVPKRCNKRCRKSLEVRKNESQRFSFIHINMWDCI